MHEFSRSIYSYDPFLPFQNKNHLKRIDIELTNLIKLGESFIVRPFYDMSKNFKKINNKNIRLEEKTGSLYASLWSKFEFDYIKNQSKKIFFDRFFKNGLEKKDIINKSIADIGCGSGRYTFALDSLRPKEIVGVDGSNHCIKVAKFLKKKFNKKNINFVKCSNLKLTSLFKKKKFDLILSNGVIHHTSDFKKSFDQIVKITKDNGKILIYIYGSGGIFWYARKRMRQIFKKIPKDYTIKCLDLLGMPTQRFIFVDNWYVPIEKHTKTDEFEKILKKYNFKDYKRLLNGKVKTDLDTAVKNNKKIGKLIWGNGELRYLITK